MSAALSLAPSWTRSPSPFVWPFVALLAAAALWTNLGATLRGGTEGAAALPWILCSSTNGETAAPRPRTVVTTLRSEPLVTAPGKHITVQLVHLPPLALTPPHVHGGDVTAYVLNGTVRSEHAGLPVAPYHAGEMFHEPYGTTHAFFENPSATEAADVLAITIHDEGAQLTTFLD
jgi:quercetin dioxygenase-like cupin family protein